MGSGGGCVVLSLGWKLLLTTLLYFVPLASGVYIGDEINPMILYCAATINRDGLHTEGIFRMAGACQGEEW